MLPPPQCEAPGAPQEVPPVRHAARRDLGRAAPGGTDRPGRAGPRRRDVPGARARPRGRLRGPGEGAPARVHRDRDGRGVCSCSRQAGTAWTTSPSSRATKASRSSWSASAPRRRPRGGFLYRFHDEEVAEKRPVGQGGLGPSRDDAPGGPRCGDPRAGPPVLRAGTGAGDHDGRCRRDAHREPEAGGAAARRR